MRLAGTRLAALPADSLVHPHCPWLAAACALAGLGGSVALAEPELAFRIDEGRNLNSFVRDGPVAAHLLLRSGTKPRILIAFPAGNSGVGLWFEQTAQPVTWSLVGAPRPLTQRDPKGRPLYGIEAEVICDPCALQMRAAVLSSVRVLRDYEALGKAPAEVLVAPAVAGNLIAWHRERLDGAPGYRLAIQPLDPARLSVDGIAPATDSVPSSKGRLRLKVVALSGETPLDGLAAGSLLTPRAGADRRAREALTFLGTQEKFLAGSWRFNTYFGRDTLISLALLAPVMHDAAVESGLASVLARLDASGEVAHEEDIGEFAVLRNAREGRGRTDTPIYDYGMIDDDFLLAPVATGWLLDAGTERARAARFLAATSANAGAQDEGPNGDALVRNLVWVTERAAPFAAHPHRPNLIGLKQGRTTGQWRDSEHGLGGGRYAYDVNAVFVPAALESAARLLDSGLLDPYLDTSQRTALARARAQARAWTEHAPVQFAASVPEAQARSRIIAYGSEIGVDAAGSTATLGDGPLEFNALALDETGEPIPILHSDEGFRLLFTLPAAVELERSLAAIMRPFPAGLMTDVGLLVANPALADRATRAQFSNSAYHGTVVWSWQQAVMAAGLQRQLQRTDLPPAIRERLLAARARLWAAIDASAAVRTSELWSWSYAGGRYRVEPFGQRGTDVDESNAAQLWSTVFLGIPRP